MRVRATTLRAEVDRWLVDSGFATVTRGGRLTATPVGLSVGAALNHLAPSGRGSVRVSVEGPRE